MSVLTKLQEDMKIGDEGGAERAAGGDPDAHQ